MVVKDIQAFDRSSRVTEDTFADRIYIEWDHNAADTMRG